VKDPITSVTLPNFCSCINSVPGFLLSYNVSNGDFCGEGLDSELLVVVRFVDIGGIVEHHWFKLSFRTHVNK